MGKLDDGRSIGCSDVGRFLRLAEKPPLAKTTNDEPDNDLNITRTN